MKARKAWNGQRPKSPEAARRYLLEVARDCVERLGHGKAGLSDVAEQAGVTRQTVYRHFASTEELFHSAAALASGGFHERMRRRTLAVDGWAARIVECVVIAVRELPKDPQLADLVANPDSFGIKTALRLGFVQEEAKFLADGDLGIRETDLDELAEILVRLLQSFLADPGKPRSEAALRRYLSRWLSPMLEAVAEGRLDPL